MARGGEFKRRASKFREKDKTMIGKRLKKQVLSVSAVLAMAYSPAHATTTISIGVAANFYATLGKITAAYTLANPGYGFTLHYAATGTLKASIIAGGNSGPYDLFLSADKATPDYLVSNYPTYVVGSDFEYAIGSLLLWANSTTDISAGLPSPLNTNFVIADPTKAPYGYAAAQVLSSSPWSIPITTTYPSGYVQIDPNILSTYNDVAAKTYPYGFIHLSAVCTQNLTTGVQTIGSGTSYHQYLYNDTSHPYSQITQYGVKINITGRTTDQNTELTNFVSYLTTNTTAKNDIKAACYTLP
jgi:molybdate transport system substrate-binding protein